MTDFEKMIYEPLVKRRQDLGLSLADVSRIVKKERSEVGRFENAEKKLHSLRVIKQFCDAYGLEVVVTYRVKDPFNYEVKRVVYKD